MLIDQITSAKPVSRVMERAKCRNSAAFVFLESKPAPVLSQGPVFRNPPGAS